MIDQWIACGALVDHTLHDVADGLNGAVPIERSAWLVVQQVCGGIQLLSAVDGQFGAFGQELSQQSVGVLSGAALPGAVQIAEVHVHVGSAHQLVQLCIDRTPACWRRIGQPARLASGAVGRNGAFDHGKYQECL